MFKINSPYFSKTSKLILCGYVITERLPRLPTGTVESQMKGEFMSALSEFGMWLVESGTPKHVTLTLTSFVKDLLERPQRLRQHYQV